jgi:methionyl-tRNA formyltransferase
LRVAFAGTPAFAARALEAIIAAGHEVPLVLTQPDRPAGRGMRLQSSAVSEMATRLGKAILKPENLRIPAVADAVRDASCDVMVVAAYGRILPAEMLGIPRLGCLNIHASLLPRWRGAAPVQRAILAGDVATGVSIMQMDAGLDTGPVLLRIEMPIGARDTAGALTESLAMAGASAIVRALDSLEALHPQAQDEALATYAPKIEKAEASLDWTLSAEALDRRVRAFNPFPGATARLAGETIKIWEARPDDRQGVPGQVMEARDGELRIACGAGSLRLETLQRPGSRRMGASEFMRGFTLVPGAGFGSPNASEY